MSVTTPNVIEVTDADFEQLVIEESKTRPVVVDLWAAWCGPCKTLGPILEKVADERKGAFLLAKLDVDANQVGNALLQAVKSQGIPTVVAFRDGQPVSMFIGAYPEQEVNSFVDQLLPTEAELVVEEAVVEEESGDLEAAEHGYREALEKDPSNREAGVGLGRILADRGDVEEAGATVTPFLPDPDAERVLSSVRVKGWGELEDVGTLASAKRLAAAGHWREALDAMLGALVDDRDEATAAMRDAFAVLGDDDPLVPEFRRKLSNALF
jgi:putative thioredoxin